MNSPIPFSQACERNKEIILDVLSPYFTKLDAVLEIGSGTAQHAIHFAQHHENLQWQCADQSHYLDGINAQLGVAKLDNVLAPFDIDVKRETWLASDQRSPALYTANTLHIMSQDEVRQFFKGLPRVTSEEAYLFIYGPFKYNGQFTSESNAIFDQSLRAREVGSAIRDFELVDELANHGGFKLLADHAMPANNQCLIWQRQA